MNLKLKMYLDMIVNFLRKYYVPIFVTGISFALFYCVLFIGYVPSSSMEPTLKTKSYIIGSRLIPKELKKGDIVVFTNDEFDYPLVKRIAAVGGETIMVDEKEYNVPDNCYFMLGDNSGNSSDSRFWKNPYVNKNQIVAKLILPNNSDADYFNNRSDIVYKNQLEKQTQHS